MRQIGTLPTSTDPRVFGDYLLSLGVTSRAIQTAEGWAIWVHDEDKVERARSEFQAYEKEPEDPRYASAGSLAEEARREETRRHKQYRENVRDMSGQFDRLNLHRRPLTIGLMAVCIAVYLAQQVSPGASGWLFDTLGFFSHRAVGAVPAENLAAGLEDIHSGQVWRLITPIFLHGGIVHLAFNMWALYVLGTVVEYTRGTRTLAILTLISALTSNVGQYLYVLNFYHQLVPWVGISGVVYAVFGYLWMKSRFEPEQGIRLHPASVRLMILWLLLGFTGIGGLRMANGAHVVGLIVGMLFGLAGF